MSDKTDKDRSGARQDVLIDLMRCIRILRVLSHEDLPEGSLGVTYINDLEFTTCRFIAKYEERLMPVARQIFRVDDSGCRVKE